MGHSRSASAVPLVHVGRNRAIATIELSVTSLGRKSIVWHAPDQNPWSRVSAPEPLFDEHSTSFAASDGQKKSPCPSPQRRPLGEYHLHEPFATGKDRLGCRPTSGHRHDRDATSRRTLRALVGWDRPDSTSSILHRPDEITHELMTPRVDSVKMTRNFERVDLTQSSGLNSPSGLSIRFRPSGLLLRSIIAVHHKLGMPNWSETTRWIRPRGGSKTSGFSGDNLGR